MADLRRPNTIIVYSPEGAQVGAWSWPGRARPVQPRLVITSDGMPWLEAIERDASTGAESFGMQPVGSEGKAGEFRVFPRTEFESPNLPYLNGGLLTNVPFMPAPVRAMTPSGAIAHGLGNQYLFIMENSDGSQMIVERRAGLISVAPAERAAYERFITSEIRSRDPGWRWSGAPIPAHKPAFTDFYPGQRGRLLIKRPGPGRRAEVPDCTDDPTPDDFRKAQREDRMLSICWTATPIWEMFGPDGRYLGEVDMPDRSLVADPFFDGDTVLLVIEDSAGTIMVKRYRLVLPGEEGR